MKFLQKMKNEFQQGFERQAVLQALVVEAVLNV